jgi:hypothetical protein
MLRRFFTILFLTLLFPALLSCASGRVVTMKNIDDLLKATLTSKGKREVAYKKWQGIGLEFTIKNISKFDIDIPLERLEKSGFTTAVINRKTGDRMDTWPCLPLSEIVNPFFVLRPGEEVIIEGEVYASDIKHLNQQYVDLDLEAAVGFTIQINDQSSYILLQEKIPIVDIEKPPTKN